MSERADYMLMDEPFSGEDVFARREALKLMMNELSGEETVLLATHHLDEVENVLDRVIVMREGMIRADMETDQLREEGGSLLALMEQVKASERRRRYRV